MIETFPLDDALDKLVLSVGVEDGSEHEYVPVEYEEDPDSPLVATGGTVVATGEPAYYRARRPKMGNWAVWLPHQCDEWIIAVGTRDKAAADLRQFIEAATHALAVIEASD